MDLLAENKALKQQIQQLGAQLNDALLDRRATLLANQIAAPGWAPILEPLVRSRLAVRETESGREVVPVDAEGQPTAVGVELQLRGRRDLLPYLRGTGSPPDIPAARSSQKEKRIQDMSPAEKAAFVDKYGLKEWSQKVARDLVVAMHGTNRLPATESK